MSNRGVDEYIVRLRTAYVLLVAIAVVLGCIARSAPGHWELGNPYGGTSIGYDVSWPNCGATPLKQGSWGVIGITGGISLHPNKCAVAEAGWFKLRSLYLNTGYPGGQRVWRYAGAPKDCSVYDPPCLAYNYGYAEGVYAVQLAARQGLHASIWWLDVETENSWDDDPFVNRASIQGTIDAVQHVTVVARIGIYSYPAQWKIITSSWLPGLPAWVATGDTTFAAAQKACTGPSFTGGQLWITQYTQGLDRNLACNAMAY